MAALNAVYVMKPILDDPRFDGLILSDTAKSVLGRPSAYADWGFDNCSSQEWSVPRLQPTWTPTPVEGPVRPFNDYPCLELTIPVFSARAVEALRHFLEPNGEILPLRHSKGTYYAYQILTKADILNVQDSIIEWFSDDANDQRGQASLIGASACDRTCWRPRGRMVDSRLRRVAIDFTQASSPRGRPR